MASLTWPDYLVFSIVLFLCTGIGLFFACAGRKQPKTTKDYLLAGGGMSVGPVSMSLLASFMSAITLLGTPAEIYLFGTQYMAIGIAYFFVVAAANYVYIPVFYNLKLTSVYEYLELRFSKVVRTVSAVIVIIQTTLYLAMVLYAPCLALEAVTGLNRWATVFGLGVLCTFYTTIGGLKAVMWTDALQITIMFSAMFPIIGYGCYLKGGAFQVLNSTFYGDRLEFLNFSIDPTERHTFWGLTFGATFTWMAIYCVSQAQAQRALSCKSLDVAKKAFWINGPGLCALMVVCSLCGFVMYATFADCDPILDGKIDAPDQLMPYFVVNYLNVLPGIPGLFVAGLFSATLSTLSAGFNALAAITMRDVIQSHFSFKQSDARAALWSRLLSAGFGTLCTVLTLPISALGQLLQAALGLFGILSGPILGVFTLGLLFPHANWKGGLAGLLSSLAVLLWIGVGFHALNVGNLIPKLPRSAAGCVRLASNSSFTANGTLLAAGSTWSPLVRTTTALVSDVTTPPFDPLPGVLKVHKISYVWYSFIAVVVCAVVGMLVSVLTGPLRMGDVDPKLRAPVLNNILQLFHKKKEEDTESCKKENRDDDVFTRAAPPSLGGEKTESFTDFSTSTSNLVTKM